MRIVFNYDFRGFGPCALLDEAGNVIDRENARTGSVGKDGKLKNAILPADGFEWIVRTKSEQTAELGMWFSSPERGWKIRLEKKMPDGKIVYTHYLFHPDGAKPGSLGCIVFPGTDAFSFRHAVDKALERVAWIPVSVNKI